MKEEVAQQEHQQYCEPWESWSDSQLQDENGAWRSGWSETDFQPPASQSTQYYEREDEQVEVEEKVEETQEGGEATETAETPEAMKVTETAETPEESKVTETAETPEESKGAEAAETPEESKGTETAETPKASKVTEAAETPEARKDTEAAETQEDAEEEVEKVEKVDVAEDLEQQYDDSKERQEPSYVDSHADFGARSWPGRCTIHDPRGLRWEFWNNNWWLGFPPRPEGDDVDLWTDPAGWSVHSEVPSTVVPSWVGSDGEVAAMEAEREDFDQGKNPYIKEQILKKKADHKKARQDRKDREEQEQKHEAGEVLWTPLTKHGFNDFILACSGGCPQVEHPSSTLSIHATSTVPKKTEPKVRWRPCTSQGVVAFRNMFAQAGAHVDPMNMNLEELIQYSHDLKDYSQIPKSTPEFVVATIKYIVYLYDEWGLAHPSKVDEWLRLRLGYLQVKQVETLKVFSHTGSLDKSTSILRVSDSCQLRCQGNVQSIDVGRRKRRCSGGG